MFSTFLHGYFTHKATGKNILWFVYCDLMLKRLPHEDNVTFTHNQLVCVVSESTEQHAAVCINLSISVFYPWRFLKFQSYNTEILELF